MSYRNGIYVAFNGCQTTDPTKSDIHFFYLLKAWKNNENIDFSFSDSHSKTYAVKDSSEEKTLKSRLQQRFRNSKSILIILTENSKSDLSLLDWEIDQAVNVYGLPVIIAYTMHKGPLKDPSPYRKHLPKKLTELMTRNEVSVLHIPFEKNAINWAIENHTVQNSPQNGSWVL